MKSIFFAAVLALPALAHSTPGEAKVYLQAELAKIDLSNQQIEALYQNGTINETELALHRDIQINAQKAVLITYRALQRAPAR